MTWVKKNEVCHEGRPHDQQNLIHESSVLCELLLIEFQERHFRVVACRSGLVLERPEYGTLPDIQAEILEVRVDICRLVITYISSD
jgi:hypothetical protein